MALLLTTDRRRCLLPMSVSAIPSMPRIVRKADKLATATPSSFWMRVPRHLRNWCDVCRDAPDRLVRSHVSLPIPVSLLIRLHATIGTSSSRTRTRTTNRTSTSVAQRSRCGCASCQAGSACSCTSGVCSPQCSCLTGTLRPRLSELLRC